jgi:DNA repair protein SbcC/Rad50
MENLDPLREIVYRNFQHVEELGNDILRGERLYADKPFAVAYIDLSDSIIERSQDLSQFQEKLIGADFFSSDDDLRWNNYLYFVAGPKSLARDGFAVAKARIESDRHFARKFVLSAKDLSARLSDGPAIDVADPTKSADAASTWAALLRGASLGIVLEQKPRTTTLELIANGNAFRAESSTQPQAIERRPDPLSTGQLRKITIGDFRPIIRDRSFEFRDVNLIYGPNGVGKTSLLEAVEALYCGRIRRDPDALYGEIEGEVSAASGGVTEIHAITTPAALKARNLIWYGRSDPQSSAISQGFTRFNFLDTDAAFRLSFESDPEKIKLDFGRLLVGPETAKLWTHLFKLEREVAQKLEALDERLPSLRAQVDLLAAEVKRYRDAPSESSLFEKEYQSRIVDLGLKKAEPGTGLQLDLQERSRLESISRRLAQILIGSAVAPTTVEVVRNRAAALEGAQVSVRSLNDQYTRMTVETAESARRKSAAQEDVRILELWVRYCEAGASNVAASLADAESKAAVMRAALRDQPDEIFRDVPTEYAGLPITGAVAAAQEALNVARQQEERASLALSQQLQLGEALAALRKDLRDAAKAVMDRSGDRSRCPVCTTVHPPAELAQKLHALVSGDVEPLAVGLRGSVHIAKETLDRQRSAVQLLSSLDRFRLANEIEGTTPAVEILREVLNQREQLTGLVTEIGRLRGAAKALEASGLDWNLFVPTREAVGHLIPKGLDRAAATDVASVLKAVRAAIQSEDDKMADLRERAASLAADISSTVVKAGLTLSGVAPETVIAVERESRRAAAALAAIASISDEIVLADGESLEVLQTNINSALMAFDKALHARRQQEQAQGNLKKMIGDLEQATSQLSEDAKSRNNLARANEVLSRIVNEYSLSRATHDALIAIRGRVSSIFNRIHSPPEYELGDLQDGPLLVKETSKQPHNVDQVSTGQRAALALSIFLALNSSAKSAPPIIIIDDPVAHVDDLNALSFLDYLRDLVVTSQKQVFFSTADARLAALFQKKFEFLGEERYRRISLVLEGGGTGRQ